VFALRRVAVGVDEEVHVAVVRGLKRHTGVDADEPADRHVDPLRRLSYVDREQAGKYDERLLLRRVTMPASLGAGFVAPDVAAHVCEARAVAQLGDMPSRLARLMGACEPLELVGTDDVIGHGTSLRAVRPQALAVWA
jgi:hypothetical protein